MRADFLFYLRTGQLAGLRIGSTRQNAIAELGNPYVPTDLRVDEVLISNIYEFQGVRLFFEDDVLETIVVDLLNDYEEAAIEWVGISPPKRASRERFERFLEYHGISLQKLPANSTQGVVDGVLRTEGDVYAVEKPMLTCHELPDGSFEDIWGEPIIVAAISKKLGKTSLQEFREKQQRLRDAQRR